MSTSRPLRPPEPIAVVSLEDAVAAVPLPASLRATLDAQVADFVHGITTLDVDDAGFRERRRAVDVLGDADVRLAAQRADSLLEPSREAMKRGLFDPETLISKALADLRQRLERLDPSRQGGDLLATRKVLGIKLGSKLASYFESFRPAQPQIAAVIEALDRGAASLEADDVRLEDLKANRWSSMQRLEQYAYLGAQIDRGLAARMAAIEAADPGRARAIDELRATVRGKVEARLHRSAVDVQGYLFLDVLKANNAEVRGGIAQAIDATAAVLRAAVSAGHALAGVKLDDASTRRAGVPEEPPARTLDDLQAAFVCAYAALDELAAYRVGALESIARTTDALSSEIAKAARP